MIAPRENTRALVLGGGGAVGVGWQTGMLGGLRDAGVDLAGAEEILGTSAGALVGALLASGRDVAVALTALAALGRTIAPDALAAGNAAFLSAMRRASLGDPQDRVRAMGRVAIEAHPLEEPVYLGLFSVLDDIAWPEGFRCTAIDAESGDLVVWDRRSGVPLRDAVAASCVVPALFPTVTVGGRRYMDGGILSPLNATSVSSTDARDVVVVLSCHALESENAGTRDELVASLAAARAEVARLRETTRVVVALEPDFRGVEIAPNRRMDPGLAAKAVQIGRQQAQREAPTLRAAWDLRR
jgi:NTE family protein